MVFYAALSDFIASIATSFGELEDSTDICVVQGVMSNVFPLASVFWTLAITYLLYANVVLLKPFQITRYLHMMCWGFPTLITLFIYTTNRIGLPDPDNVGWCFVGNTSSSPGWSMSFWTMMSFYVWIFLAIVAMIAILILIHIETGKMKASRSRIMSNNTAQITVTSVYIYPAVVFLCWIIPCVTDMIDAQSTSSYAGKEILNGISSTLPLIQGFITSTVFCLRTSYIKRLVINFGDVTIKSIESSSKRMRSSLATLELATIRSSATIRIPMKPIRRVTVIGLKGGACASSMKYDPKKSSVIEEEDDDSYMNVPKTKAIESNSPSFQKQGSFKSSRIVYLESTTDIENNNLMSTDVSSKKISIHKSSSIINQEIGIINREIGCSSPMKSSMKGSTIITYKDGEDLLKGIAGEAYIQN
eukprot:gene2885-5663_t